jgi:DnaK suppressor protein
VDLKNIKDKLITKRDNLLAIQATAENDRAPVELDQSKIGRLSRMDALQGQAMSEAVEARRQLELRQIEAALQRLEEGEYGFCLSCGGDIQTKRLELDPATPLCIGCAGKASKS